MGGTASKAYELLENMYYYEEEEASGPASNFPNAVLVEIFSHMKGGDVVKAGAVCRQWDVVLRNSDNLWKYLYQRDFKEAEPESGVTWRNAYLQQYQQYLKMFKQNTEEIARIVGFHSFDPDSKSSYEDLVQYMKGKLDVNLAALGETSAGV